MRSTSQFTITSNSLPQLISIQKEKKEIIFQLIKMWIFFKNFFLIQIQGNIKSNQIIVFYFITENTKSWAINNTTFKIYFHFGIFHSISKSTRFYPKKK